MPRAASRAYHARARLRCETWRPEERTARWARWKVAPVRQLTRVEVPLIVSKQSKCSWSFAAYCRHVKQSAKTRCARRLTRPGAFVFSDRRPDAASPEACRRPRRRDCTDRGIRRRLFSRERSIPVCRSLQKFSLKFRPTR